MARTMVCMILIMGGDHTTLPVLFPKDIHHSTLLIANRMREPFYVFMSQREPDIYIPCIRNVNAPAQRHQPEVAVVLERARTLEAESKQP